MSPTSQSEPLSVKHWTLELSRALLASRWHLVSPLPTVRAPDAFLIKLLAHPPSLGLALLIYSPTHASLLFESLSAPTLFRRLGLAGNTSQSLGGESEKARWETVVDALVRALARLGSGDGGGGGDGDGELNVSSEISRWEASLGISYPCTGLSGGKAELNLSLEALSPAESAEALNSHVIFPLMGCVAALTRDSIEGKSEAEHAVQAQGKELRGSNDVNLACLQAFFAPRNAGQDGANGGWAHLLSSFSSAAFGLSPTLFQSSSVDDEEDPVSVPSKGTKKEASSASSSSSASLSPEARLSKLPRSSPILERIKSPSPRASPSPTLAKPRSKPYAASSSDDSSDDDVVVAASGRPVAAREETERGSPQIAQDEVESQSSDGEVVMGGGRRLEAAHGKDDSISSKLDDAPKTESGTESEDEDTLPPPSFAKSPRTVMGVETQDKRGGSSAQSAATDGLNMFPSGSMKHDDVLDDLCGSLWAGSGRDGSGTEQDLSATLDEDDLLRGSTEGKAAAPRLQAWKPAREVVRTKTEAATLAALTAKSSGGGGAGTKRVRSPVATEREENEDGVVKDQAPSVDSASWAPKRGGGAYKRGLARRGRF